MLAQSHNMLLLPEIRFATNFDSLVHYAEEMLQKQPLEEIGSNSKEETDLVFQTPSPAEEIEVRSTKDRFKNSKKKRKKKRRCLEIAINDEEQGFLVNHKSDTEFIKVSLDINLKNGYTEEESIRHARNKLAEMKSQGNTLDIQLFSEIKSSSEYLRINAGEIVRVMPKKCNSCEVIKLDESSIPQTSKDVQVPAEGKKRRPRKQPQDGSSERKQRVKAKYGKDQIDYFANKLIKELNEKNPGLIEYGIAYRSITSSLNRACDLKGSYDPMKLASAKQLVKRLAQRAAKRANCCLTKHNHQFPI